MTGFRRVYCIAHIIRPRNVSDECSLHIKKTSDGHPADIFQETCFYANVLKTEFYWLQECFGRSLPEVTESPFVCTFTPFLSLLQYFCLFLGHCHCSPSWKDIWIYEAPQDMVRSLTPHISSALDGWKPVCMSSISTRRAVFKKLEGNLLWRGQS